MGFFESIFGWCCCGKGKGKKKKTNQERAPEHRNKKNQRKAQHVKLSIEGQKQNEVHDHIRLLIDRQDEELAALEDLQPILRVKIQLELEAEGQEGKELKAADQPMVGAQDRVNLGYHEEVEDLMLEQPHLSKDKSRNFVILTEEGEEASELKLNHLQKDETPVLDCNFFNAFYYWRDPQYDFSFAEITANRNAPGQCSATGSDTPSAESLITFKCEQPILSDVEVETENAILSSDLNDPSASGPELEFTDIYFWRLPHVQVEFDIDVLVPTVPTKNLKFNNGTVEINEIAQDLQANKAKNDLLQKPHQAENDKGIGSTDDITANTNRLCHFLQATGLLKPIEESGPSTSDSIFRPGYPILESNPLENKVIPSPGLCDTEFSDTHFRRVRLGQLDHDLFLFRNSTAEIKEQSIIKDISKTATELPLPVYESMAKLRNLAKSIPHQNPPMQSKLCPILLHGISCPHPLSEVSRLTGLLQTGHDLVSNLNPKEPRKTLNEPKSRTKGQENSTSNTTALEEPSTSAHTYCHKDDTNAQIKSHILQATGFQKPIVERGQLTGAFDQSSAFSSDGHSKESSCVGEFDTRILNTDEVEPRTSQSRQKWVTMQQNEHERPGRVVESVYEELFGYSEALTCDPILKKIDADFAAEHSARMKENSRFALLPPITMEELRKLTNPPLQRMEEEVHPLLPSCLDLVPEIDCQAQHPGISCSSIPIEMSGPGTPPVTPYQFSSTGTPFPPSVQNTV